MLNIYRKKKAIQLINNFHVYYYLGIGTKYDFVMSECYINCNWQFEYRRNTMKIAIYQYQYVFD